MADRVTVVPPRDPWPFSTVTADDLEALVGDGGYVVSFIPFHERGFGVPASHFMRALLHHYGVELQNFNPNSIAQAAIFMAVCEGFLGIDPHWDLWTHLFSAEFFAASTDVKKVRMAVQAGGCTLQLRSGRVAQYIPASLVSSNKGWQRRWFYLRNDGELLPPFSQRVVTAATDAWRHGTPHERQKNLEPLLQALKALREGGLTAAGVVAAIHRRRVLPLAERRLPLCEMTPEADWEGSRMSPDPLPFDALQWRVSAAKLLPPFSQRVVTTATDAWRHGTPHERQKNLGPLLQALEALREGGLTAAGVIAAIHLRRVLPLAERRLSLWEMTPEVDWEGSRMSPDPLPFDALQWRVSVALGKPDPHAFSQLLMRPDRGCVTLVSVRFFSYFAPSCL